MTKREVELLANLLDRVTRTPALNLDDLEDEDREVIKACRESRDYLRRYWHLASEKL